MVKNTIKCIAIVFILLITIGNANANAVASIKELTIARVAGMSEMLGKVATKEYEEGLINYTVYCGLINQANHGIWQYNNLLNDSEYEIPDFGQCHY